MTRLVYLKGSSNKFWEIDREGVRLATRWGRVGSEGQTKEKFYADVARAQADLEKQIGAKLKKGYVEEGPAAPAVDPSNPEIEARIAANPDDPAGYAVYGDWLQSQGHPLGELAAIQAQLALAPTRQLRKAQKALFETHTEALFGPTLDEADALPLAFIEMRWGVPTGFEKKLWEHGFSRTMWKHGFIEKLWYDTGYYDDSDERGSEVAAAFLKPVLALPSARFIRHLVFGDLWADYARAGGPEMEYAVQAVIAAPCAPMLRVLEFRNPEHDISGVSCNDHGLAKGCPNLEELTFSAGQLDLTPQRWPRLKIYRVHSGSLDGKSVRALSKSQFPVLEELEIWFGSRNYGGNTTLQDLIPLLQSTTLPALKVLGLDNAEFGDAICGAIVKSRLLSQLEELSISMGIVRPEGARVLVANKEAFAHLRAFSISGYFDDATAKSMTDLGWSVEVRGPEDDDYVYVEVGE